MNDTLFIECDCGCHALKVDYVFEDGEDDMLYMHHWELVGSHFDWRNRLRQIWEILRYGRPCIHEIILRPKDITRLIAYLSKYAEE